METGLRPLCRKPRGQVFSCRCLLDSSRTNITSATDNNIYKKNSEGAVHQICKREVTLFGCSLHRLIHKSFVTTAHRAGDAIDFDFMVAGPWYDPVLTAHLPGWGVVTNDRWA